MDYAVVTSLLGIVDEQLPQILPDDKPIIKLLSDKLRFLQAYVHKSESTDINSNDDKPWADEIRDVAAIAEAKIESNLTEVYLAANRGESSAMVAACQVLHQSLEEVVKICELVEKRISVEKRKKEDIFMVEKQKVRVRVGVGSDEFEKIKELLIYNEVGGRQVISIVGNRGPEKSTLARNLYEDPSIGKCFDIRVWVTLSQEFNTAKVLADMLRYIDPTFASEISVQVLENLLYRKLKGHSYLVVIDDILAPEAWKDIQMCFPDDLNGSRILITTPTKHVAGYVNSIEIEGKVELKLRSESCSTANWRNCMVEVGELTDEIEEIKDVLVRQQSSASLKVISIVGEEGMGKTTLARRVYDDPLIAYHFEIRCWITVSREFNKRNVLIDMLHSIVSWTGEISKDESTEVLAERLCKSLTAQRYLIVIDDIWYKNAWEDIKICLPDDSNGSRILITTVENVASSYWLEEYIYPKRSLSPDESWNLFAKKVLKSSSLPQFESIGRSIVATCRGIPLAILIIAGVLLANPDESSEQLVDFAQSIYSKLTKMWRVNVQEILKMTYHNLPSHLKACFLYLGVFLEGNDIHVKKLIKLWVAEGFLKSEMDKSLEEVAEDSLCDLIYRNLVQVVKRSYDGKIELCRLHDSVRDFCLREAGANILFVGAEYNDDLAKPQFGEACRWMSCQSHRWSITQSNYRLKIRSIIYLGKDLYLAKCKLKFPCLELLRVLDFSLIRYWHGIPNDILDLVHLRYLALTTTGSLCNSRLSKLQRLQTLILSSWVEECRLQFSCDILNLPLLRHAQLDRGSSLYLPSIVLQNLRTLFWLKIDGWDSRTPDFKTVPNLKELGIYAEGKVSVGALDGLGQLHKLEKLKLEMGMVERFNLMTEFPPNLKKLSLCKTYLPWEKMDVLGKLPNLELLKLKHFAFRGPRWETRGGGFQRLKFLLIAHLDLVHWNANANHFPVLECLVLRCCQCFEKLPDCLIDIRTLRLVEIIDCHPSLVDSAKLLQEEALDFRNDYILFRHNLAEDELPKKESGKGESSSAI